MTQALSSELSAAELGVASHPVLASDSMASSTDLPPVEQPGASASPEGEPHQEAEPVTAAPAAITPAGSSADTSAEEGSPVPASIVSRSTCCTWQTPCK